MVVIDDDKVVVNNFTSQLAAKLRGLSRIKNAFPFDPNDYKATQIISQEAEIHFNQLLNVSTDNEFAQQRDLLQGKQQENWIKFSKEVREFVETEVAIHQALSVTKLGWEPANEKRPTQKTRDGKLKGHYLLMVVKPKGTGHCNVPATSN